MISDANNRNVAVETRAGKGVVGRWEARKEASQVGVGKRDLIVWSWWEIWWESCWDISWADTSGEGKGGSRSVEMMLLRGVEGQHGGRGMIKSWTD